MEALDDDVALGYSGWEALMTMICRANNPYTALGCASRHSVIIGFKVNAQLGATMAE